MSWVRVPPEAAQFFLGKVGVLCCFALFVSLTLLASFFLPSHLSFKNMYTCHTCVHSSRDAGTVSDDMDVAGHIDRLDN